MYRDRIADSYRCLPMHRLSDVHHGTVRARHVDEHCAPDVYFFSAFLRGPSKGEYTGAPARNPHANTETHVHMPSVTKGFRAGQHVRVRFIDPESSAFGWIIALLFARARPFSISSKPAGSGPKLLIKKEGSSTRELFKMAGGGQRSMDEKVVKVELGQVSSCHIKCLVQGPYSGHAGTMFEAYLPSYTYSGAEPVKRTTSPLGARSLRSPPRTGRARTTG